MKKCFNRPEIISARFFHPGAGGVNACGRPNSHLYENLGRFIACVALLGLLLAESIAYPGCSGAAALQSDSSIYEGRPVSLNETQIDRLVSAKLKPLHIQPVLCSDSVFVRRAFLDLLGTLPTAQEARLFIDDPDSKNKRSKLIDQLLDRPEFAEYWAMKWGDTLRIKAEFPVNLWPEAAQAYHQWVRASLAENKPYDKFARELLTASGSNFRNGPVNFYRAIQNRTPEGIAGAVALTFMGSRVDTWPKKELSGMAAFFSQVGYKPTREWKEQIVFWDPLNVAAQEGGTTSSTAGKAASGGAQTKDSTALAAALSGQSIPKGATFPDGTTVKLTADRDPRDVFASWLVSPTNPWFKRAIVNRIWYWLLGRGIIQEPDDIRPINPPSNPALLAYLESELVAQHFNLKHIYRLILNSQTYQLSSLPHANKSEAEANFAVYPVRRLDAEVLIDAINKVTGTTDQYTSPIPEPFTYIPQDMPAVAIGDGSITSPFLTLFGRSSRTTGMADERNNKPVPAQALHMLNSSHIQMKLAKSPQLRSVLVANFRQPSAVVEDLYLTVLSRYPTHEEMRVALSYGGAGEANARPEVILGARRVGPRARNFGGNNNFAPLGKPPGPYGEDVGPRAGNLAAISAASGRRPSDWLDIAWALVNSTEFMYKH